MVEVRRKWSMRRMVWSLFATSLAVTPRVVAESNILACVPQNAAGFILLPHVEKSDALITEFMRNARADYRGFDLSELETTVGFAPGTIDLTQPVIIVAERPAEFLRVFKGVGTALDDPDWPAIGFTPRDWERFGKLIEAAGDTRRPNEIGSVAGAYGKFRLLLRDDMAFVCPRRGPLEAIRRATPPVSAWSNLSDAGRRDALKADIFVNLSMDRWRDRMRPSILAVTQLIKFGMMMQQKDPARFEETGKLANWFFDGVVSGIDQMKSLSIGFAYDGERFELAHYHTFADDGWMSKYLRQVRRNGEFSPWRAFPDRPFLLAGAVNWRVPPEAGLPILFNQKCMKDPQLCRKLPLDKRKELDRDIRKLAVMSRGEEFIATSDPNALHPIRVYGLYKIENAEKSLELQRRVREHMGELMGGLFPGMADLGARGKWREINGVRCFESELISPNMPQMVRDNISVVYGENAVYQEAAVNDQAIAYAVCKKGGGLRRLIPVIRRQEKSLAENRSVTNAMARLPSDANIYVLVDVRRVALSTPVLIRKGGRIPDAAGEKNEVPTQVGPILAWAAYAGDGSFTGRFEMDRRDVGEAVSTILKVGRQLRGIAISTKAAAKGE